MRVLIYVLSVLVATVLLVAGLAYLVLTGGSTLELGLGSTALGIFIYGPVILGSFSAYWDTRSTEEGRAYFRRRILVTGAIYVVGAALVITDAVLVGSPPWMPVVVIVVALALAVGAIALGRQLLRREETIAPIRRASYLIDRPSILRKVRTISIVFVAVLLGTVILLSVFLGSKHVSDIALLALTGAFISAAIAGMVVTFPLINELRDAAGRDIGRVRRIAKVVLGGKSVELSADELDAASRYAQVAPVSFGFQLAYLGLLYAGLILQRVQSLTRDPTVLDWVLLVLLVAVFLVLAPLSIVRINRARQYARDHPPADAAAARD